MAGQTPADAGGRSAGPSLESLLHLVDRAEKGTLLAPEAVALRAGLRAWASELAQARRTVGGLTAQVQRLRQQLGAAAPRVAVPDVTSQPAVPREGP